MTKILDYIRGDTRQLTITCLQSDGITPLDLTGASVYFTMNASNTPSDDTSAALQKIQTVHTSPTLGITTITINPADTTGLTPQDYYYDIQVVDASGNRSSLKQDIFRINADITRS